MDGMEDMDGGKQEVAGMDGEGGEYGLVWGIWHIFLKWGVGTNRVALQPLPTMIYLRRNFVHTTVTEDTKSITELLDSSITTTFIND